MSEPESWLLVAGAIGPDHDVHLAPSFKCLNLAPASPEGASDEYSVQLESAGAEVHEFPLAVGDVCAYGDGRSFRIFAVTVPTIDDLAVIRIMHEGSAILERTAPREPQVVDPPHVEQTDEQITISWRVDHSSNDNPLTYIVMYDNAGEGNWKPLCLPTNGMALTVPKGSLAGGDACRMAVRCTDGFQTFDIISEPFDLDVKPCQALILWPMDDAVVVDDRETVLKGQGYWLEEEKFEEEALVWNSDISGELGRGDLISARLHVGRHQITLVAGTKDRTSEATIAITVISPESD